MAFREVNMLEVKEILRLWLLGVPKKQIASQLGFDVKTVRRYLAVARARGVEASHGLAALDDELVAAVVTATQPSTGRPRGEGWVACEEHREFIAGHVAHHVRLTKIGKLLRRRGVAIEYPTLRRFALAELGVGRGSPTVPVADCAPGAEVQIDTGWMTLLEPDLFGKRRRFKAWIFTPVRSRYRFVYPVFQETTATAIEACDAAWAFYGGVFKVAIPDNTKAIVAKADPIAPVITEAFREYAQSRGFQIDTARVRRPKDKARVERTVPTVRDDCFGGERLRTLEDSRARALHWCVEEYGMKRHARTQRLPREHFEAEERAALLAAPTESFDVPLWGDCKVARDQFAAVAKALYSLPLSLRGHTLRFRADSQLVRFYERGQIVKTHPRKAPGQRSIDKADFPEEALAAGQRDIDFFVRKAREHGQHVGLFAEALAAKPLPWRRLREVFKLLSLARKYGARLDASCKTALDAGMADVYRLADLVRLDTRLAPSPAAKVIPLARYLRPSSQYALPLARRERSHDEGDDQ
jgi:transposase